MNQRIARKTAKPSASSPAMPEPEREELGGAIREEIARCSARALELATRLEGLGIEGFGVVGGVCDETDDASLFLASHAVRGLAAQAVGVLEELQFIAGRLHALAAIRSARAWPR